MGRHPTLRKKMALVGERRQIFHDPLQGDPETGRDSRTWRPTRKRDALTRYGCTMASIGHPIVGDELYGKKARRLAPRPLLHAYKILIEHPVRKAPLQVEAPVPQDFKEFIDAHAV